MPKSRSGTVELPELLTVDQVCQYLNIDDSTLRRYRRTGLFPPPDTWVGGNKRFPRWFGTTLAAYVKPDVSGVTFHDRTRSARRQRKVSA